jgi:hypothetical protein
LEAGRFVAGRFVAGRFVEGRFVGVPFKGTVFPDNIIFRELKPSSVVSAGQLVVFDFF